MPSASRGGVVRRVAAWAQWFGVGRLVACAVSVVVVAAGGWWLVRPPAAAVEQGLPRANRQTTVTSTLPLATGSPAGTRAAGGAVSPSATAADDPVVHVAGAVVRPGVYRVPRGARVTDAILLAGGPSADADADALNLAALLVDGQRVYVPRHGEVVTAVLPATAATGAPAPLDLNSATPEQLDTLPGVGPATAAAIVAYRAAHGPFRSVDDLAEVRGIGPAKLDAIRPSVHV